MFGSTVQSMFRVLSVLALMLTLSGSALADPPENNPGQPFAEIRELIEMLSDQLDAGPCEVPPVWGQTYELEDRFVPVFDGAALCDQATGLVWEGSPDPGTQDSWADAIDHCLNREVGGQYGFHLPMIEQLMTLVPLKSEDLNAPNGPFTNVVAGTYWSASTDASDATKAWRVGIQSGNAISNPKTGNSRRAWCVRGGRAQNGF